MSAQPPEGARRNGRLQGKVAIVCGAGMRVPNPPTAGHAASVLLARDGARVVLANRNSRAAEATAAVIAKEGGEASVVVADLTREADCQKVVEHAVTRFGHLDILVNSLGDVSDPAIALADFDKREFDFAMDTNFRYAAMMTRFATQVMKRPSSIINFSSITSLSPNIDTAYYGIAKAAVEQLTRATAVEFGPLGIRANCIRPGLMWSPFADQWYPPSTDEEHNEGRRRSSLVRVVPTHWHIAPLVVYLASDESEFMTGQVLTVDGGMHLIRPAGPSQEPLSGSAKANGRRLMPRDG